MDIWTRGAPPERLSIWQRIGTLVAMIFGPAMPTDCSSCIATRSEQQDCTALCDDCWATYEW